MPGSDIIRSASDDEYYKDLIAYSERFAEIGTGFFRNFEYRTVGRRSLKARLAAVGEALAPQKKALSTLRNQAANLLLNDALEAQTFTVLGYYEFVEEFLGVQAQGQLNVKLVEMRDLKDDILPIVEDVRMSEDIRALYMSLLIGLITVRLAAFECLDSDLDDINELARSEIAELLGYTSSVRRVIERMAELRVRMSRTQESDSNTDSLVINWFAHLDNQTPVPISEQVVTTERGHTFRQPRDAAERANERIAEYQEEMGVQSLIRFREAWLEFRRSRGELVA